VREILLATGNPKKAREMSEILSSAGGGLNVRWRMLGEFTDRNWPEPVEDGSTFAANAEIKARHYGRLSGLWTIADDSGLVVDALGGEPGVRSARFAGEPKSDAANNVLLIERLAGVPGDRRSARFVCVVVLCDGESVLATAEGTVEGRIVDEPRGSNGFGYDPHFFVESAGMTAAQMSPEAKHAVSHRGKALRQLQDRLVDLVGV
jgi:XTP/dITP diphosphohydrolase